MRLRRLSSRWLVVVVCFAWLPSGLMCAEPCAQFPPAHYTTGQSSPACDGAVRYADTVLSPFVVFALVVAVAFPVLWLLAAISNRKLLRRGRESPDPVRRAIGERDAAVVDQSGTTAPRGKRGADHETGSE